MTRNPSEFHRSLILDLVLTVLLCGLWNAVVQYHHCETLNFLLKEEKYSFWKIYLFSLLTCGLYFIYHEYRKSADFARIRGTADESDAILAVILSIFGLSFVYDAIFQSKMNEYLMKISLPQTGQTTPFQPS